MWKTNKLSEGLKNNRNPETTIKTLHFLCSLLMGNGYHHYFLKSVFIALSDQFGFQYITQNYIEKAVAASNFEKTFF